MEKLSYVLGSEMWESQFDELFSLVKEHIIDVWEIQKHKLYDSDSGPGQQLILSLHLGRGMVSSIRMVSLVRMVS